MVQVLDRLTELRDVPAELVLAALGTAESPEHALWRAVPRRAMLAADVGAAEHSLDHGDWGTYVELGGDGGPMRSVKGKKRNPRMAVKWYAALAFAGLLIGIMLLLFFVISAPSLVERGVENQVFYLLLIPWGLSCALFLFGIMGSYAHYSGRQFGGTLELGGPVVVFLLVMVGGFKLVPTAGTFDLTLRVYGDDAKDPIVSSGKVMADFDRSRLVAEIQSNGVADFKNVPGKFRGAKIKVFPLIEGYERHFYEAQIRGETADVYLARTVTAGVSGGLGTSTQRVPVEGESRLVVVGGGGRGFIGEVRRSARLGEVAQLSVMGSEMSECQPDSGRTVSSAAGSAMVSSEGSSGLRFAARLAVQGGHYRTVAACLGGVPVGLTGHDNSTTASASLAGTLRLLVTAGKRTAVVIESSGLAGLAHLFVLGPNGEKLVDGDLVPDGGRKSFETTGPGVYVLRVVVDVTTSGIGEAHGAMELSGVMTARVAH